MQPPGRAAEAELAERLDRLLAQVWGETTL